MRITRLWHATAVAAVVVAMTASDAMAWGRRGGSAGSYGSGSSGSYGSASSGSYGSASAGSYGSSGSSGSHGGGLFARWHARKAARASAGSSSYGASSGSYGSASSGSYGSYASSGSSSYGSYGSGSSGSYGSYGGDSGVYYESAPVEAHQMIESQPADAQPMAPEVAPTPATPPQAAEPSASIRVKVPADALVFVNDRPTASKGETRNYVSRNLMAGRTYAYDFRVEFQRDGKPVTETKTVRLQAGRSIDLSFGEGEQMAKDAQGAPTKVTLHVPATAKVSLAGAETHQTGETRTFLTKTLKAGQKWDGYVVSVQFERDGQTVTEEKTLSIEGGQSYDLSFDFGTNATQVASVN